MPATMKTMGIDQLSVPERLALVQDIWDSIAEDSERAPLSDELKKEIDRRQDAYEQNPESAIPWEQVEAEAMARMKS